MMIKGVITCCCGQLFGFETIAEKVKCPTCDVEYKSLDYGIEEVVPDPIDKPSEVIEDGTPI